MVNYTYQVVSKLKGGENLNGKMLKSIRILHSLTQEGLAKRVGITPKTYNRKELGIVNFTVFEIIQLASILNLNLENVNEIFFDNKLTECIYK